MKSDAPTDFDWSGLPGVGNISKMLSRQNVIVGRRLVGILRIGVKDLSVDGIVYIQSFGNGCRWVTKLALMTMY